MSTMDIALCQIPVAEGNAAENRARILAIVDRHGPAHDLIVLPETCLSGFARRSDVLAAAEPLHGPTIAALCERCARLETSVVMGFAELADDGLYNTSVLIGPQGLVGSYRKTHLWRSDRGIFRAGDVLRVFPWNRTYVGLLVCYDIEFPEPARTLARLGADLIVVVNGNMDPYGPVHARAASARAQENQVFVAMANRIGQGRDAVFAGDSALVGPTGEMLLRLDRRETVGSVRIDLSEIAASRSAYSYLRDRRDTLPGGPQHLPDGVRQMALAPAER
jgi:(R)-amidase